MTECPLTETQIEIVQALASGSAKKLIANRLGMQMSRLSQHLNSARDRAHANTTEQLVAFAVKRKWVK